MADDTSPAQQRTENADWRPIPDPTVLTTEAQERGFRAERDYVNAQVSIIGERLRGIDRATELLNETVNRVPTETQTAVGRLQDLMEEKFSSIETQFAERDTRQERESRDNKVAVDAAFAAQKEAAAKSEETFNTQINKSELATAETISKLQDLTAGLNSAITGQISDLKEAFAVQIGDLKDRVKGIESGDRGQRDEINSSRAARNEGHQQEGNKIASIAIAVAFLGVCLIIVASIVAPHIK